MACAPPIGTIGDALGVEVPTTALGERFERELVADPFDEHDRTRREGPLHLRTSKTRQVAIAQVNSRAFRAQKLAAAS